MNTRRERNIVLFLEALGIALAILPIIWERKYGIIPIAIAFGVIFVIIFFKLTQPKGLYAFMRNEKSSKRFSVNSLLSNLGEEDKLYIIGRTCKSWFTCKLDSDTKKIHKLIKKAVKKGAVLSFIMQNLNIPLEGMDEDKKVQLEKDQEEAVRHLKRIKLEISQDDSSKSEGLLLGYLNEEVTNSRTARYHKNKLEWLSYDIGVDFKIKTTVVFYKDSIPDELEEEINRIKNKRLTEEEHKTEMGFAKIKDAKRASPIFHSMRNNSPDNLLKQSAHFFVASKEEVQKTPPPLSIQFLLTNNCTTICTMCTHFNLRKDKTTQPELELFEIQRTLKWIKHLGTNSVIFSGGEPLAHPEIETILQCAHEIGLAVGLLSSGIVNDRKEINPSLAKKIAECCEWVQISVDSFDEQTYKKIRAAELQTCMDSIETLKKADVNLEVCCTIQKENSNEFFEGKIFENIKKRLSRDVRVRFKFAHGSNGGFLIGKGVAQKIVTEILKQKDNHQIYNRDYFEKMIAKKYFTHADIEKGLPLDSKMKEFERNECTCHALKLTLFINSNGSVYPCCYLFDDNVWHSNYREKYFLGNIRDKDEGYVIDFDGSKPNPIKEIWENKRLNQNSNNLTTLRKKTLPIESDACGKCTRHIHQNELLNKVDAIFREFSDYNLAQKVLEREKSTQGDINNIWV